MSAAAAVSLLRTEKALARVRTGLEARSRRIEGRVGRELAAFVSRPGKMLRSRFCLLLGGALGVPEEKAMAVSRAVELVHNASLLHDDCVDGAALRRGQPTPNAAYSVPTALLLGDLAFSQGLEEAVEISPEAARLLVTTVREMTVGELQEEFLKGSTRLSEEAYLGIAARKTGALFEWAGAVLSGLSPHPHAGSDPPRLACAAGILLQIIDDVHDYTLSERASGKDAGQDARNRRVTLPCLYAFADRGARTEALDLWDAAITAEGAGALARFLQARGFVRRAREKGRELTESMKSLIRRLPLKGGAQTLEDFVELLAGREF